MTGRPLAVLFLRKLLTALFAFFLRSVISQEAKSFLHGSVGF